ncbi:MAG: VOC family protein [Planctomycetota bacterium]
MPKFVWADLSTYNTRHSRSFYEAVFGWKFYDASDYFVAMLGSNEIAGLFETPAFFQKIKMPHFWMSYIAVGDAMQVAETAKGFAGAKVELTDDFYDGKVALIRDPQGAGFTVYDGGKLDSRKLDTGHLVWNELHVSDASQVLPFYEQLFGWTMRPGKEEGQYGAFDSQEHVANILVIPNEMKGEYEYWVCTFAVDDLAEAKAKIQAHGGGVISDEGHRIMMHDDSGEAFFYIQSQS